MRISKLAATWIALSCSSLALAKDHPEKFCDGLSVQNGWALQTIHEALSSGIDSPPTAETIDRIQTWLIYRLRSIGALDKGLLKSVRKQKARTRFDFNKSRPLFSIRFDRGQSIEVELQTAGLQKIGRMEFFEKDGKKRSCLKPMNRYGGYGSLDLTSQELKTDDLRYAKYLKSRELNPSFVQSWHEATVAHQDFRICGLKGSLEERRLDCFAVNYPFLLHHIAFKSIVDTDEVFSRELPDLHLITRTRKGAVVFYQPSSRILWTIPVGSARSASDAQALCKRSDGTEGVGNLRGLNWRLPRAQELVNLAAQVGPKASDLDTAKRDETNSKSTLGYWLRDENTRDETGWLEPFENKESIPGMDYRRGFVDRYSLFHWVDGPLFERWYPFLYYSWDDARYTSASVRCVAETTLAH